MSRRTMTTETALRLVDDLLKEQEQVSQREALLLGTMLMGDSAPPGSTLLGMPIRITVEWPEGYPFGWSKEQLVSYGRDVFVKAGGTLPE